MSCAHRYLGLWFAPILILSATLAHAEQVSFPIRIEPHYLNGMVAEALDLDRDGRGILTESPCNQVELSNPRTRTSGRQLEVELALTAYTGVELMGACRGPQPWRGQIIAQLVPEVDVSGLAVKFTPTHTRLLRADGKEGLFTKPVWALTESLILPQLGLVRVDLSSPLAAIDSLISELSSTPTTDLSPLTDRTRIRELAVTSEGLRATLGFTVAPRTQALPEEPPLDPAELAAWATLEDEFDGFLTTVITTLAEATESPDLRFELLGVLLDTRHAIAVALTEDQPGRDPIRSLFIEAWDRLRPYLSALDAGDTPLFHDDLRLAGFIAGGDALRALDALGPEYGIDITRDGLRRLARLLLADGAPASFTPLPLEVDEKLKRLFYRGSKASHTHQRPVATTLVRWLIPTAEAAAPPLAYQVPQPGQLRPYLEQIAALLEFQSRHRLDNGSRLPDRLREIFNPLVQATAWKESCWRQYIGSPKQPRVLMSPVGALGIMQINGRVWRGLYDLDRLTNDIGYNVNAGAEILEHYLVDYAIRRGEHRQPGGDENLIRATYAAYNGGPGQLARYRRQDTPAQLRSIDKLFWDHYQKLKTDGWPEVSTCYPSIS